MSQHFWMALVRSLLQCQLSKSTPVDETTKNDLINNSQFPIFLYPHANGFCAIIGGTELKQSTKWNGYFSLVILYWNYLGNKYRK